MLNRFKDAGRQAKVEHQIKQRLTVSKVAEGAVITLRRVEDKLRATVLLAENVIIDAGSLAALEANLVEISGLDAATLVATAHNAAPTPPQKSKQPSAHDNPLAFPQKKPTPSAPRERPTRSRPGDADKVIAVASGKGGVGKSTIAANLAVALAANGDRVGLLDLDIYGPSLPVLFGLEGVKPTVEDSLVVPLEAADISLMSIGFLVREEKAVAWRGPMVMGAAKQLLAEVRWPTLDWLVIDTPPGTGDAHLTLLQRTQIDGAVLVSTPSPLAIADVRRGASLFQKMGVPLLGLVENMATLPDGTRPFGDSLGGDALKQLALDKLASLPLDPVLAGFPLKEGSAPPAPFVHLAERVRAALNNMP
ncbi:MAG: P-loop NTPase [Pseudomonadota bacterium]